MLQIRGGTFLIQRVYDEIKILSPKNFNDKMNKKYDLINNANIRTVIVDGAGHFFRDLYLDEVIDVILE